MSEKIGKDVIKKKSRKRYKKVLESVTQINLQIKVLEELGKRSMTSKELREYVESLGGDYSFILPILKESGLIKVERIDTGRRGRDYVYSIKKL